MSKVSVPISTDPLHLQARKALLGDEDAHISLLLIYLYKNPGDYTPLDKAIANFLDNMEDSSMALNNMLNLIEAERRPKIPGLISPN